MPKKGTYGRADRGSAATGGSGGESERSLSEGGDQRSDLLRLEKADAGLGVSELRELRQLWDENGRLKRLVAHLSLDRQILQEDRVKKAVKPGLRRKLGHWVQQTYRIGQRRAARLMKVGWSTWLYRRNVRQFEEVLRRRLCEIAATYVRYGYRRLTVLLRREGWKVNAKRIYRLYAEEQLIVRMKQRKKIGRRQRLAALWRWERTPVGAWISSATSWPMGVRSAS
jgi:hypothetical protein